ncbi:MAG TPA: hypothetical protein VFQ15_07640 [Jiangellaceae bacterium]|nr:hypothetical protein [Jiangellaceae bacterium]
MSSDFVNQFLYDERAQRLQAEAAADRLAHSVHRHRRWFRHARDDQAVVREPHRRGVALHRHAA